MKTRKKGQGGVSALIFILGSIILVSATLTNSSNDSSTNANFDVIGDYDENITITDNETLTPSIPAENLALNYASEPLVAEDEPIFNQSLPEKTLLEIVEEHKDKLNDETKDYLKALPDNKEVEDYIIKFKGSIDEDKLSNVNLKKKYDKLKVTHIRGKAKDIENLIEDDEIEYLELDQDVDVLEDSIPFNIAKIKADTTWNLSKGSGVKVAVLDTGIASHTDLGIAGGYSVVSGDYSDNNGHGTAVAGVIASLLNDEGLVGVSPDVSLYSVKIMDGSTGDLSNAIAGIEWAIENNMDIVSMSFGFESYSQIFKDVLEEAYNDGILLVAASGNEGTDNILYPAKYASVIAVGATTANDELASFSSYGFEQELVAPGVDIDSTSLGNSYSISSGTSMAAPHVTGVAALIKSFNSTLTNVGIRNKLRNDALDLGNTGKDDFFGYGLVQANLESSVFVEFNDSYYYEVFTILNFGLPDESYSFWLDGTGTIDDVTFTSGYYLVNITYADGRQISTVYHVAEDGTIEILSANAELHDDFSRDGSSTTDEKLWLNGVLLVHNRDPAAGLDAECFDFDYVGGTPDFDECYAKNSTAKTDCINFAKAVYTSNSSFARAIVQVCDEGGPVDVCEISGLGVNHTISNTTKQLSTTPESVVVSYHYCSSIDDRIANFDSLNYYIFDRKRARCTSSTGYTIEGRYDISGSPPTEDWLSYSSGTCSAGTVCSNDLDEQIITNKNGVIPNPCVSLCSGNIFAVSVDSKGRDRIGDIIKLNGIQNGTTDSNGEVKISFTSVGCGINQNVSAYCSNNASKTCGLKQASIDFQNDNDTLIFDCNVCREEKDLSISLGDIGVNEFAPNVFTINITVHAENINNIVNITVKGQHKDTGLIARENSSTISLSNSDTSKKVAINLDITDINYLHIYIDPANQIPEPKTNNYVLRPFIRSPVKAYVTISTGFPLVDQAIKDYIETFVDSTPQNEADVTIAVGLANNLNSIIWSKNSLTRSRYGWWSDKTIYFNNDPIGSTPYNGLVGAFKDDKNYIFILGKDIDGLVAATKRLTSASQLFLTKETLSQPKTSVIDDFDVTGLSVMDLFHNSENNQYYNYRGTQNFADVVTKILNDNSFEISIKTVKTTNDNTTLRLKNINTDYSSNFKDAIVKNAKPVVLARGLWSDLLTWEILGKELSSDVENARDTWLIELTGGPTQDCDTCPNYKYEDLVDYYWPALIAGVEQYSGQNKLDYVGFSNGCRVGLDSLKNWSSGKNGAGHCFNSQTGLYDIDCDLAANAVDAFVAVGCPGAFDGHSSFLYHLNRSADELKNKLSGDSHISGAELGSNLRKTKNCDSIQCISASFSLESLGDFAISFNLADKYLNFIQSTTDLQPGANLNINRFLIFNGKTSESISDLYDPITNNGPLRNIEHDLMVSTQDGDSIYSNIQANKKYHFESFGIHGGPSFLHLADKDLTKRILKRFLNNQTFSFFDRQYLIGED